MLSLQAALVLGRRPRIGLRPILCHPVAAPMAYRSTLDHSEIIE